MLVESQIFATFQIRKHWIKNLSRSYMLNAQILYYDINSSRCNFLMWHHWPAGQISLQGKYVEIWQSYQ